MTSIACVSTDLEVFKGPIKLILQVCITRIQSQMAYRCDSVGE